MTALASVNIHEGTFLAIVVASAIAGTISAVAAGRGLVLPVVVLELIMGVIIGPHVIGLHVDPFVGFFSDLGLGLLFFFAGYEIDIARIMGQPLRLGLFGWALSLALAYTIGGILAATGIVLSLLYTGSALATTAIGMLIPILSDTGELKTRFGTYLQGAGAVGEFGPILLLTLFLSTESTEHNAVILVVFIALAVCVAVFAVRSSRRTLPLLERTLESSAQLAVRWIVVLQFALALLAFKLGLDLLLGGFAAGLITRHVLGKREIPALDSKLSAVAFGLFVPFFFIVGGMKLDISSIFAGVSGVTRVFLFLFLFLVVRGTPAMLLYRSVLDRRERVALGFMSSTQLPLVLAITTLASSIGQMRPTTAAALVEAAVLSTLIFPIVGLRLRGARDVDPGVLAGVGGQAPSAADP